MTAVSTNTQVRVGVGILVKDPKNPLKVFAGRRKGSHGVGTIALPGGHLEMYESWEECAIREVMEETGLRIMRPCLAHVTNDRMPQEGKHYVTIFMMAECAVIPDCGELGNGHDEDDTPRNTTPRNMEPEKCDGWDSYGWDDLVSLAHAGSLFGPLKRLVEDEPEKVIKFFGIRSS
mmetsp:Transcript_14710/g.21008  ORF Transcript_14710/g.21008 Transcript_14710/m.21008 type:complete len:176 (-) Transcript_14710:156-683(-)